MENQLGSYTKEEFGIYDIHIIDSRGRSKNCSDKGTDRRDLTEMSNTQA